VRARFTEKEKKDQEGSNKLTESQKRRKRKGKMKTNGDKKGARRSGGGEAFNQKKREDNP